MRPSTIVCPDCGAVVPVRATGQMPKRCKLCATRAGIARRAERQHDQERVVRDACPELARAVALQRAAINMALVHLGEGQTELAKAVLRSVPATIDLRVIDLRLEPE